MRKSRKVPPPSTVGPAGTPPPMGANGPAVAGEPRIHCRRVDADYTAAQHKDCPYCFGRETAIRSGEHAKFCDFKPGQDPIVFGFPTDRGHYGTT